MALAKVQAKVLDTNLDAGTKITGRRGRDPDPGLLTMRRPDPDPMEDTD